MASIPAALIFFAICKSHLDGIRGVRQQEDRRLQRQNALQAGACLEWLCCEQPSQAPQCVHTGPDKMPEQLVGKVALLRNLNGIEVCVSKCRGG